MLPTNSSVGSSKHPRVPVVHHGLQYNFCKCHTCLNFGIPPLPKGSDNPIGKYMIVAGGKDYPLLKCPHCNESPPLKSNLGIQEEIDRISSYLSIKSSEPVACCPNPDCENHTVPVGTKKAYRSFGLSSSGAKRVQCSLCRKTFSLNDKPTKGQHDTHHNIDIFKLLVNKVPLSRIINVLGISWNTLYNRIDFIHQQCMAFASDRENKFKTLPIKRVYISVDRQEYELNWTQRKDKRNIVLSAMTSADNLTGYVFGMNLNFDHNIDKELIEEDAKKIGDNLLAPPFRKYSRLWLEHDYLNPAHPKKKKHNGNLVENIADVYKATEEREDVEAFDQKGNAQKLPNYGAQVKAEYTMIAHFYFLKKLLGNIEKFRFFLDQESGIRSACFSAFHEEIKSRKAEAFYVSIEKQLTVDEKRRFKKEAEKRFKEIQDERPDLTDVQIKLEMLKEEISNKLELGHWKDKWVRHPLPNMAEAKKAMCWLTEHDEYDLDHKAWLYNKASLHGVDSYFEKVRRRLAMFERPIHSQGNNGRTWNGYAAYNPQIAVKMLEIFRIVHNYVDIRKDKVKVEGVEKTVISTPAMRIGLAKAPIEHKTILYFR